ncbi:MAG: 2,3-bisphosphoglycerate-independent phosphoglycerate mutase, partial [Chloroflexota bacterium]|nr:2,3-bisphosphoglycerate-independent phosphoglycerate mutase [Chloroflexota bacterium]
TLLTSGLAVGLPEGQMGNSEVGHLNIGAGFVVYQWISRIDKAILDGELAVNPVLTSAIDTCIETGHWLHIGGLVSDGGVHSHTRHIEALVRIAARRGLDRVVIHAFTDGRDTSPTSGLGFVTGLEATLQEIGVGRVATVCGRYYAMDRDRRWERTQAAYDLITRGVGSSAVSAAAGIQASYDMGVTDEFIHPIVVGGSCPLAPGDIFLFANFRSDRCRQLTAALADPDFAGFERPIDRSGTIRVLTLTRYDDDLPVDVVFPPHDVEEPLAKVISEAGMSQFHCAETEKYPHVTFFLNGGREEPYPAEERVMVPSPKVATYDLQPEMSASGVADATIEAISSGRFDFVVVNFANCDMVGHTGSIPATIRAVETVDAELARVLAAVDASGAAALVIADHGNAEEMIDRQTGGPMTAHTTNPVPCVLVGVPGALLREGAVLSAVAPTMLQLLGLPVPDPMSTPGLIVG